MAVQLQICLFLFALLFLIPKSWAQEDLHIKALKFAREGKLVTSIKLFKELHQKYPYDPQIAADYVVVLSWAGRYKQALRLFEKVFATQSPPPYVWREVAGGAYHLKRYHLAEKYYREALKYNPRDLKALEGLYLTLCHLGKEASELEGKLEEGSKISCLKLYCVLFSKNFSALYPLWQEVKREAFSCSYLEAAVRELSEEEFAKLIKEVEKRGDFGDLFWWYALRGKDREAFKAYARSSGVAKWPSAYRVKLGWVLFRLGKIRKAHEEFVRLLSSGNRDFLVRLGYVYTLSALGEKKRALEEWHSLKKEFPTRLRDLLLARAYLYEREKQFLKAILVYEKLLSLFPGDPVALKFMLRAYSALGLPPEALERLKKIKDARERARLRREFLLDMAAQRLRWGLPKEAEKLIKEVLEEDPQNPRALGDLVPALADQDKAQEAIKVYTRLSQLTSPPWWSKLAAAKAYLYLDQPQKAVQLYQEVLQKKPESFEARIGLFYALQELRRFTKAWKLLTELEKEPWFLKKGRGRVPNWRRMEVALARGWLLGYENRLGEAQKYLEGLKENWPGNNAVRVALGHIYYWRGWLRLAREELSIARTRNPKEISALTGLVSVLNDLGYKKEARQLWHGLASSHPRNKHVRTLEIYLQRDVAPGYDTRFYVTGDDDQGSEFGWYQEASLCFPDLNTRLFGFLLWKESDLRSGVGYQDIYERAGFGFRRKWAPSWLLEMRISGDLRGEDPVGIGVRTEFYPNDYWQFKFSWDSFSTDVPLRARTAGVHIRDYAFQSLYRWSEWQELGVALFYRDFNDGNERWGTLSYLERGLFSKNNWFSKGRLEFYFSKGTKKNVPYFNPRKDYSLTFTHLLQHTAYHFWDRYLIHRLWLTFGIYKEQNYAAGGIGKLRFEEEWGLAPERSFYWALEWGRSLYDGEAVSSWRVECGLHWRF